MANYQYKAGDIAVMITNNISESPLGTVFEIIRVSGRKVQDQRQADQFPTFSGWTDPSWIRPATPEEIADFRGVPRIINDYSIF